MSLIIFSDGTTGIVGDDGWVEEFDYVDLGDRELDGQDALPAAFIDIDAAFVLDTELPQRTPFAGPPAPYNGADADVVERFADAVREWAEES